MNGRDRIAVAMSGGVDSAVAACLLREQGHAVFGVTARMTSAYSHCRADEDILRAAHMAADLGIEHHVVDVTDEFKRRVIDGFVAEYLAGRTPSPCAICNREIKFGALLGTSRELGGERLATGHYARIVRGPNGPGLARGVDAAKDQSYFLARLTPEQLDRAHFPLGAMRKSEVVRYAAERRLAARESRESQDLCFVTSGTHGDYIDLRGVRTQGPGDIVDETGRTIGRHRGIHGYTVGQRKGLGIATGKPMYVAAIDAERNIVRVGERAAAMRREMIVADAGWIAGEAPAEPFDALCQIRYHHEAAPCRVSANSGRTLRVFFDEPQFAITPGQLAVFYRGGEVLGGGWIA